MTDKVKHTPLEWSQVYFPLLKECHIRYYNPNDGISETLAVLDCGDRDTDKANAKFIIKAVNNYDKLLATLKEIKDFCAETGYTPSVKEQVIAGKCFLAIAKAEET